MPESARQQRRYVSELQPGERFDQVFLISGKELRQTQTGAPFIKANLSDRTGTAPGRVWQANESIFNSLPDPGFIQVRGRAENYQNHLQIVVEGIRPVSPGSVDLGEFLPRTERDVDEMWERLLEILRGISSRYLKTLVKQFVTDEKVADEFKRAPAAIRMHHAYIGGLLEHTLAVMELGLVVLGRYPELDGDLLLTAIFLHDIGKTAELSYELGFEYTDEGQLVGHLVLASAWAEERARDAEAELGEPFPKDLLRMLQHMILSHHGYYEFGSPKLPAFPEAILLHHLDNIDAKLNMSRREIEEHRGDAHWTNWISQFQTKLYKRTGRADTQQG